MRKILIATHGYFADGVMSSLKLLVGEREEITIINAYVDETDVTKQYDTFFNNLSLDDEVVVFTDLYGGSVNQQLFNYTEPHKAILITGFNLPILLEVLLTPERITKEKAYQLVENCRNELKVVEPENKEEEAFF
ncbi:PTS system, mannose-specific IIA component [Enterococcus sp. AZ135]|uniref:PTS sugar transporter subunit IIA n=1 Tax=unclassified Enterococcus TaxID=2608891 RepID=UPI003F286752